MGSFPASICKRPDGWHEMLARRDTRAVIAGSYVTFPKLSAPRKKLAGK